MFLAAAGLLLCLSAHVPAAAGEIVPVSVNTATPVVARSDSSCDIIGTVAALKSVSHSPFTDGAPTTTIIMETHISINVQNRRPHNAAANSGCNVTPKNELVTYKLCSSAKPQEGDKIMATEAGGGGSAGSARCLFDLEIMPRAALTAKQ